MKCRICNEEIDPNTARQTATKNKTTRGLCWVCGHLKLGVIAEMKNEEPIILEG